MNLFKSVSQKFRDRETDCASKERKNKVPYRVTSLYAGDFLRSNCSRLSPTTLSSPDNGVFAQVPVIGTRDTSKQEFTTSDKRTSIRSLLTGQHLRDTGSDPLTAQMNDSSVGHEREGNATSCSDSRHQLPDTDKVIGKDPRGTYSRRVYHRARTI